MHEVVTSAVGALFRGAGRAGIDAEPAMAAAGISRDALDEPDDRVAWPAFLEFIAALERAAANPPRFDLIVEGAVLGSPRLTAANGLFEAPLDFYRFVSTLFLPAHLRPLRVGFEDQPGAKNGADSRAEYRVIVEVAAPYGSSPALLRMVGSVLRALPCVLGLDPAEVRSDVHDRGAAFAVRGSARRARGKAKSARGPDDARALVEATFAQAVGTNRALDLALADAREFEERLVRIRGLGADLGRCTELGDLGNVLAGALRAPPFVCESVSLSLVDHGAEHAIVRAGEMTPGAVVRAQPLRIGDREVARLETSGYLSTTRPDALDDIVPLLVVAIDRLLISKTLREQQLSSRPPEAGPSEEALHRRLARSAGEWQLTPRQLACVERLVRGRSNREIARDIGCTERTVEAHLAVVFRRAGVRARSSLVARFWSEAW